MQRKKKYAKIVAQTSQVDTRRNNNILWRHLGMYDAFLVDEFQSFELDQCKRKTQN